MRVVSGPVRHDSSCGVLFLDRRLDPHQLAVLVDALTRSGLEPRDVWALELDEGAATFHAFRRHGDEFVFRPNGDVATRVVRVPSRAGG